MTLIEVLLILSILVFLLALLVPGLSSAREQTRRVMCANNLRQWGIALQCYRDEFSDYIPLEGGYLSNGLDKQGRWFNVLPPYIGAPPYREVEGVNKSIKEFPNAHVWICPSKQLTDAYKSGSGKNQFHYAMNQVLDGMGAGPNGSADTPGFPDPKEARHFLGKNFHKKPQTVFLFDIAPNLPSGSPRDVASMHYRDSHGARVARFHGDYANFLFMNGGVANFKSSAWVENNDNRHGRIRWENPQLYWGYPPPR